MNLQRLIEQYISFQQSLGSSCTTDANILRAFGRARGARASVAAVRVRACGCFSGQSQASDQDVVHQVEPLAVLLSICREPWLRHRSPSSDK